MKKSKAEIRIRQQKLLDYLQTHTDADMKTIAKDLNASISTIRRDLIYFRNEGILKDRWSSVIDNSPAIEQISLHEIESLSMSNYEIRKAIAKRCLSLIKEKDIIFMNTSSTALLMYSSLPDANLVIVTNNYLSVTRKIQPTNQLILTGGEVSVNDKNSGKIAMFGGYAEDLLNKIKATKCILGVSGISRHGISTSTIFDYSVNKKMIEHCIGDVIVLADHTKIGKEQSFTYAELKDIDILITDAQSDPQIIEEIKNAGVKVLIA
ncbi:MAG: DeoR/GlpR transcriptional regulator [Solobacterium sp.]|nr:DeoR/GlpR transcriptional regulator [Solobacterium sp.]